MVEKLDLIWNISPSYSTLLISISLCFVLLQSAYGPGQPTSLVFATPPPPQMSSAPQPRQVLLPACLLPTFRVSLVINFSSMRSLFPTLSHVLHCCFCFKALAKSLLVKSALPPFLSCSTPFSAVLPVCRASYFTPTGTNSPYCFNLSF